MKNYVFLSVLSCSLLTPKMLFAQSYSSRVADPFSFCSQGKPSRFNPLRPVYDSICAEGRKNDNAQLAQQRQENAQSFQENQSQNIDGSLIGSINNKTNQESNTVQSHQPKHVEQKKISMSTNSGMTGSDAKLYANANNQSKLIYPYSQGIFSSEEAGIISPTGYGVEKTSEKAKSGEQYYYNAEINGMIVSNISKVKK